MGRGALLASCAALCVGLVASPANGQVSYREVAGVKEFTGRMIVRPRSADDWISAGRSRRDAAAAVAAARRAVTAYEVVEYVAQTDEYIVRVPAGGTENGTAAALHSTGGFRYVEPDWKVFPIGCPNDPDLALQWHHDANRMQSCDGWAIHTGTPTIVVGYCDTGILTTHEDLQLHRQEAYNAVDRVWESAGGSIGPIAEHGTWVTGCGSGNGDNAIGISGVGWNLGHRMLRVSNDSSGNSSLSILQHAARTSIENGDKVASVSYSGVDSASNLSTATYVKSIGGLLVWAAGNDGNRLSFGDRDADDLIVAGGTDENDNRASFSNFGPFVDVAAPANNIYTSGASFDTDYDTVSGTSFATPLTAGLCALIWSYEPGLTPDDVESMLKAGCDDLGSAGIDDDFGYGRIDVLGALSQLALRFEFPNGRPASLELTGGTTVEVHVLSARVNPVPGTGLLHVNDGDGWRSFPMSELQPNEYLAEFPGLPGADCGDPVEWYVSAGADDANTYTNPFSAPAATHTATGDDARATATVLVDLDFETATGWTVENINVDDGAWDRGVPAGGGDREDPATDFDGSGQCWLTDNVDGNSDVDGGPTRLLSPVYDVTGFHQVTVSYARWFSNDDNDADRFDVHASLDGGLTWVLIESVSGTGGWTVVTYSLGDFVPLTSQLQLRFSATDNPNDSVTEAGLDAFQLVGHTCPLKLDVTPASVALTGHVDFNTWTGAPGTPTLTFVVDVDGIAVSLLVLQGTFDGGGRFHLGADVPNDPALSDLDLTFLAFGFDTLGELSMTNLERLHIE